MKRCSGADNHDDDDDDDEKVGETELGSRQGSSGPHGGVGGEGAGDVKCGEEENEYFAEVDEVEDVEGGRRASIKCHATRKQTPAANERSEYMADDCQMYHQSDKSKMMREMDQSIIWNQRIILVMEAAVVGWLVGR